MKRVLNIIKPWLGLIALAVMLVAFYKLQQEQKLVLEWPTWPQMLTLVGIFPLIPLCKVVAWKNLSSKLNIDIGWKNTLEACVLSMAGRYLPGKVLFVLGRVQAYGPDKAKLSMASFAMVLEFVIENAAGALLLLWACSLDLMPHEHLPSLSALAAITILGAVAFPKITPWLQRLPKAYRAPKELRLPISCSFSPILWTLAHWFFYLLATSILCSSFQSAPWQQMLSIAAVLWVSSIVGTLAIFTPGGLGVRESVATLLLAHLGIDPATGFSIALMARFASWGGELSLCLLYLCLQGKTLLQKSPRA